MFFIRTVPFSPSPLFHLLRFYRMDSFGCSANNRVKAIPNSPSCGSNEEYLRSRNHNSNVIMIGKVPVNLNCKSNEHASLSVHRSDDFELKRDKTGIPANVPSSYYDVDFKPVSSTKRSRIDLGLETGLKSNARSSQVDESSLPNQFGKKNRLFFPHKCQSVCIRSESSLANDNLLPFEPFNICSSERRGKAKSRACWKVKDTGKLMECAVEDKNNTVLRPGMVLLKHYINPNKQITLVKTCQKLGLAHGGFYQPSYENGAKLRLHMMCLGLDWDPQTRQYEKYRTVDGSKPPEIPHEFSVLVKEALKDARALIKNNDNTSNIDDILPTISPDICIANFYFTNGRLGLHQDRDESKDSLANGLPVVSFSLGNSAEFLYGDQRDVDKAEKIVLESGDVLIFGGESRHIFHGVSSIIPKSTPKFLLDHTGLRPGRLNLTFRKY